MEDGLVLLIDRYKKRLEDNLAPDFLEVLDDSLGHVGHKGAKQAGPISHLLIRIQASSLRGLSPVQSHQKIYALFDKELKSGSIHALRIEVL